MGGEKEAKHTDDDRIEGSPPHGRGKAKILLDDGDRLGITPAWAGKSDPLGAEVGRPGDHPRMGGEKTKKIP